MRGAPIPPAEYDGEHLDTDAKLQAEGWAAGLDVWEQVGKAYGDYVNDSTLANAQLWSLREAVRAEMRSEATSPQASTVTRDAIGQAAADHMFWWDDDGSHSAATTGCSCGWAGPEYVLHVFDVAAARQSGEAVAPPDGQEDHG